MRLAFTLVKTPAVSNGKRSAFTLVELLVVVTIIVVLLALLAPAMEQAIYQAELATCGARMSATADGVNIYAMDFKRSYPYRSILNNGDNGETFPWHLSQPPTAALPGGKDDRIPLRGYVDMKLLVDALCKPVDLNHPTSWIYSSNNLWFGWTYKGYEGMTRVGKRMTWPGQDSQATAHVFSSDWLITDGDDVFPGGGPAWNIGSHPDELGILGNLAVENGVKDMDSPATQASGAISGETASRWRNWGQWDRGEIEMNAAAADGSVARYNDVRTYDDDRMGRAPTRSKDTVTAGAVRTARDGSRPWTPSRWINIPIR